MKWNDLHTAPPANGTRILCYAPMIGVWRAVFFNDLSDYDTVYLLPEDSIYWTKDLGQKIPQ